MDTETFKAIRPETNESDKKYWKVNFENYVKAVKSDFIDAGENNRRNFKKQAEEMDWHKRGYYDRYTATNKRREKLADLTQSIEESRSDLKVIATIQALYDAGKIESTDLFNRLNRQYDYMTTDGYRMIWWQDTWLDPGAKDINLETPIIDDPEDFGDTYPNIESVLPEYFSVIDSKGYFDYEFYQDKTLGSRWLKLHKHGLFQILPKLKSDRKDRSIFIKGGHAKPKKWGKNYHRDFIILTK